MDIDAWGSSLPAIGQPPRLSEVDPKIRSLPVQDPPWSPSSRLKSRELVKGTYTNEEKNYIYHVPDDWVTVAEVVNQDTQLTLRHTTSNSLILVIEAHTDGRYTGVSAEQLYELACLGMKLQGAQIESTRKEDRTIDGIPGRLFKTESRLGSLEMKEVAWVGRHNGTNYCLTLRSLGTDKQKLVSVMDDLLDRFHLLDRDRNVSSTAALTPCNYLSPDSGFSLLMGATGWRKDDSHVELEVASGDCSDSYQLDVSDRERGSFAWGDARASSRRARHAGSVGVS